MTTYTDFHYSPTGSGVISGAQVLEQTEQGINGLGQYVQDNVSGAIDTANEALTTARNADSNATAAINLANSFNAQIIAANQTAGNALTTAQSAQNTANAASSLATTANNNAATALNTANAASAGVTTLTGTVNSLGNRMTAAENAINTNAGNITTLQNNLATTNANVTAAANAASAAQATATSAQSTATLARNQAYVLRYTATTITGGGTIAYADIDNTDNIKAGDKIIDATGAIYEIASVDIANETVTVSASEIINLAVLSDLFNSANTWTGNNTFSGSNSFNSGLTINNAALLNAVLQNAVKGDVSTTGDFAIFIKDKVNGNAAASLLAVYRGGQDSGGSYAQINIDTKGNDNNRYNNSILLRINPADNSNNAVLIPQRDKTIDLGTSTNKWKTLNGVNPGALSLPKGYTEEGADKHYINIASVIQTLDGTIYNYTMPDNGWISVRAEQANQVHVTTDNWKFGQSIYSNTVTTLIVSTPFRKGDTVAIKVRATTLEHARFYPMLGNV